jgi:hypothetical protein
MGVNMKKVNIVDEIKRSKILANFEISTAYLLALGVIDGKASESIIKKARADTAELTDDEIENLYKSHLENPNILKRLIQ